MRIGCKFHKAGISVFLFHLSKARNFFFLPGRTFIVIGPKIFMLFWHSRHQVFHAYIKTLQIPWKKISIKKYQIYHSLNKCHSDYWKTFLPEHLSFIVLISRNIKFFIIGSQNLYLRWVDNAISEGVC